MSLLVKYRIRKPLAVLLVAGCILLCRHSTYLVNSDLQKALALWRPHPYPLVDYAGLLEIPVHRRGLPLVGTH